MTAMRTGSTSRARLLRSVTALAAALVGATGLATAQTAKQAPVFQSGVSQIVERCGNAGSFTIGRPLPGGDRLRQTGENQFTAADGTTVSTNAQRQIVEVKVTTPGAFTQRYVVIGDIRLNEVLRRYGQPQPRSRQRKSANPNDFVLEYAYEGVSFLFSGMPRGMTVRPGVYVAPALDKPVAAVIVHEKERDPLGRDHECALTSKK